MLRQNLRRELLVCCRIAEFKHIARCQRVDTEYHTWIDENLPTVVTIDHNYVLYEMLSKPFHCIQSPSI
jgi:hypothetical protein